MAIKFYYRFSHTEHKLLKATGELFYGVSAKGTTVANYASLFSLFINETKKPYFIDPHTFDFNFSKQADKRLAETYRLKEQVSYADFLDKNKRTKFEKAVISFQRDTVNNVLATEAGELEEVTETFYPEFIIAPYFILSETLGPLDLNMTLIKESQPLLQKDEKLYAQICLSKEVLQSRLALDKILEKYLSLEEVDGYTFWIDLFDEYSISEDSLSNLKFFIQKLAESKKPIVNLYGGFYSMLLSEVGLAGLSHTLTGGEKQDIQLTQKEVKGGRVFTRYYVSKLKRKLPEASIDVLKIKAPELLKCECNYCNPRDLNDRYKRLLHFATKRKEEVDKINSGYDFKQEIDETVKEYGKKLFPAINIGYLQRWISALRK